MEADVLKKAMAERMVQAARLRKLAEILSATSTETMPSPAGLRSAARLLVAIAAEIKQIRTAEEERAEAHAARIVNTSVDDWAAALALLPGLAGEFGV